MRTLLAAALLAATPAAAQMDHSRHMPGMTMPAPKPAAKAPARKATAKPAPRKPAAKPVRRPVAKRAQPRPPARVPAPAADASCFPAHAAMGHCTAPTPPEAAPSACSPEHAAMGHCTLAPAPAAPVSDPACPPEHAAMGHCTPAAPPATGGASGTALPVGNAPAPAAPPATYADRVWGAAAMAPARAALAREHGGMRFSQVMVNIAEVQVRDGRDGFRWDGEAWFGGDVDRVTVKTEGEGEFGATATGEVQALYSRAIDPYFNLQAGVRQDAGPGPDRTWATIGIEGLAPYWFDVEGALFVSDKGDVAARLEGYYDQRITQRLVLQPRAEVNLSAQAMPANCIGAGLVSGEAGLRLRYEIAREFAPYVGVSWERRFGETARLARAEGEGTGGFSLVAGLRVWF